MQRRKRRSFTHIMEEQSLAVIRDVLPPEWVMHEYKPDYGIDFIVEVFSFLDDEQKYAETLGELFFVQAKSVQTTTTSTVKAYPRVNVEKTSGVQESQEEYIEIDIIKYEIETAELATIQSMGAATPVLLFLVALDTKRVFFVCLNDLIDKVIIPLDPMYAQCTSKTIYIPVKNEVLNTRAHLGALRFYARRSKMFAAFAKFGYQENELSYLEIEDMDDATFQSMIVRFIQSALHQDIWHTIEWGVVKDLLSHLQTIQAVLTEWIADETTNDLPTLLFNAKICWQRLANLSQMYEEICREWFLPTFLSRLLSYPDHPRIHKVEPDGKC
jgi:hypothetical protein